LDTRGSFITPAVLGLLSDALPQEFLLRLITECYELFQDCVHALIWVGYLVVTVYCKHLHTSTCVYQSKGKTYIYCKMIVNLGLFILIAFRRFAFHPTNCNAAFLCT